MLLQLPPSIITLHDWRCLLSTFLHLDIENSMNSKASMTCIKCDFLWVRIGSVLKLLMIRFAFLCFTSWCILTILSYEEGSQIWTISHVVAFSFAFKALYLPCPSSRSNRWWTFGTGSNWLVGISRLVHWWCGAACRKLLSSRCNSSITGRGKTLLLLVCPFLRCGWTRICAAWFAVVLSISLNLPLCFACIME
jgi:hypothetical protein